MKVYIMLCLFSIIMAETILLNGNHTNDYIYNSFNEHNSYSLTSSTLFTTNTTFIPTTSYVYNNTVNYTFIIPNMTYNTNYNLGNQSIVVNAYNISFNDINKTFTHINEYILFSVIYLNSNITRELINTSYTNDNYTISVPRNYTKYHCNGTSTNNTFSNVEVYNHSIVELLEQIM